MCNPTGPGEFDTPLDRLKRYAGIAYIDHKEVMRFGCPTGSLNTELVKVHPALQKIISQEIDRKNQWLDGLQAQRPMS